MKTLLSLLLLCAPAVHAQSVGPVSGGGSQGAVGTISASSMSITGNGSRCIAAGTTFDVDCGLGVTNARANGFRVNAGGINAVNASTAIISAAAMAITPFFVVKATATGAGNTTLQTWAGYNGTSWTKGNFAAGGQLSAFTDIVTVGSGTLQTPQAWLVAPQNFNVNEYLVGVSTQAGRVNLTRIRTNLETGATASPGNAAILPSTLSLWNNNQAGVLTENITAVSTGSVGISCSNPRASLNVRGSLGSPRSSGAFPNNMTQDGIFMLDAANSGVNDAFHMGFFPPTGAGVWMQTTDLSNAAVHPVLGINSLGGNVGISTGLPQSTLDVAGSAQFGTGALVSSFTSTGNLIVAANLVVVTTATVISTASAHIGGPLVVDGGLVQKLLKGCATGPQVDANGLFSACVASDRKLKTGILDLHYDPGAIDRLRPVAYRWKKTETGRDRLAHIGFIAQEVEEVYPHAVVGAGVGLKGLDSNALIAELVLEVQQLRKRVSGLERR